MILKYDFEPEEEFFRGLPYEYEPDDKKLKEKLVKILVDECKETMGSLFSEEGAYQMANFIVYEEAVTQKLAEYYKEWLQDEFESEAYDEYKDSMEC